MYFYTKYVIGNILHPLTRIILGININTSTDSSIHTIKEKNGKCL